MEHSWDKMCAYLAYTLGNRGRTLPQGHWDHMEGHQGKAAFHILSWNPIEKATVHAKMIILYKAASSLGCLPHNTHRASAVDTGNCSRNTVRNRDGWMPRFSLYKKASINGIPASYTGV